jgi:hypothetical protein
VGVTDGGAGQAGEGRAVVYSVELLHGAPEAVVEELRQPDVMVAVVVESGQFDPSEAFILVTAAEDLADLLIQKDVQDIVGELQAGPSAYRDSHADYEVDFHGERVFISGLGDDQADRVFLAMAASDIRIPGRPTAPPPSARYRCDHPQHHVVIRPAGSTGETCGEHLSDGTVCPGKLKRF